MPLVDAVFQHPQPQPSSSPSPIELDPQPLTLPKTTRMQTESSSFKVPFKCIWTIDSNGNCSLYNSVTSSWSNLVDRSSVMAIPDYDSCRIVSFPNKVYFIGAQRTLHSNGSGSCGDGGRNGECFDFATRHWSSMAKMKKPRTVFGACQFNDYIYVVGGCEYGKRFPFGSRDVTSSVVQYDPILNAWFPMASMQVARAHCQCLPLNGAIYSLGGYDGGSLGLSLVHCERYDPRVNMFHLFLCTLSITFVCLHR